MNRFERQELLPELGTKGQCKLGSASVLVVGAGGLGCPALAYLAAAGVGQIGIIDGDSVSFSNLNRQILFGNEQIGYNKAQSAAALLHNQYPDLKIEAFDYYLNPKNAAAIIEPYDIVIDASDNTGTRYLLGDATYLLKKPLVYGAIYRFEGQVAVFENQTQSLCYRDLHPSMPTPHELPGCATSGVLGVLPGLIGTLQATEALKLLTGIGEPLFGKILYYNAKNHDQKIIKLQKHEEVEKHRPLNLEELKTMNYQQSCGDLHHTEDPKDEFDWQTTFRLSETHKTVFIDLRQPGEAPKWTLPYPCLNTNDLSNNNFNFNDFDFVFLFCYHGISSLQAARYLSGETGHPGIRSVTGGAEILPTNH